MGSASEEVTHEGLEELATVGEERSGQELQGFQAVSRDPPVY